MRRKQKVVGVFLVGASLILLGLFSITSTAAEAEIVCYQYPNTHVVKVPGDGWACGSWGGLCEECIAEQGGFFCMFDDQIVRCRPFQQYPGLP